MSEELVGPLFVIGVGSFAAATYLIAGFVGPLLTVAFVSIVLSFIASLDDPAESANAVDSTNERAD